MSVRNYNKLYVHTDREEGSEKLLLGYKNKDTQFILKKNTETYFHIPYYTETINLATSTLIQDGATAGPFPAASDRIYKNRKGYGNTTSNGTGTGLADGVWFCSWLYKDKSGKVQWMDRFYNPGQYVLDVAESQLTQGPSYRKNNPVYRDVPSKMVLEEGVLYRYFHVGEETSQEMVTTFQGLTGSESRVKLNLNGWGTDTVDTSYKARPVTINTNGSNQEIYNQLTESDRVSAYTLNFNNNFETKVYIDYDQEYGLADEFTLSFWGQSNDWYNSQTTQLVGNFSNQGGYGIFIDTLSSYPFFVIPETGFGHMLYVNEGFDQFLDKSLHPAVSLTATPCFVSVNSDSHVYVVNADETRRIKKLDHAGKTLAENSVPLTLGAGISGEVIRQILCGQYDSLVVITDRSRYYYDSSLNLIQNTPWQTAETTRAAFAYDIRDDTAELLSFDNVYDVKFLESECWCLSATIDVTVNGNLIVRRAGQQSFSVFAEFDSSSKGTALAIDPFNRLWVMRGNNRVSVYDANGKAGDEPLFDFSVGPNSSTAKKNISFICVYDRKANTREWKCLIYYGDSSKNLELPQLYVIDMKGQLERVINILSLFDFYTLQIFNQTEDRMEFFGQGDFTGYEHRRIFNNLSPYRGNPQLILKAMLKDKTKVVAPYTQFKSYYNIKNWNPKSWQHFALVLKNRLFTLYNNAKSVANIQYSGAYEINYESQPPFFIGSPVGVQFGFNQEIGRTSLIFNGLIQDVKVYNYAIDESKLEVFQRAAIPAEDMYWSLPTPNIQYIETVERMFKNKIPGAKSSFFNIKVCGSQIKDPTTRAIIEEELRGIVEKIKPTYTNLLKVIWVE